MGVKATGNSSRGQLKEQFSARTAAVTAPLSSEEEVHEQAERSELFNGLSLAFNANGINLRSSTVCSWK